MSARKANDDLQRNTRPVPAVREKTPAFQEVAEDHADFLKRLLQDEDFTQEIEERDETPPDEVIEVLVFQLGKERYGIEIHQVAEIIRYMEPTYVPHTVSFLDGIISLRGRMIPVVNARKRLGHESKEPDKKTRIIVLHDRNEFTGILVDSASQVMHLPKKDIEPTPFVVVGVDADFIDAVCEHQKQMIILLNLDRFLQLV
jgi:purine-binding chemotaxis protein CheW